MVTVNPDDAREAREVKRPDPEKLAADQELYALLQRDGFLGTRMRELENDLWLYGWRCLRAWMREGTIVERCAERNIRFSVRYTEVEAMQRRGDLRDGLAVDTLAPAVEYFTRTVLTEGRWDQHRATMRTYFIGACLVSFRDAFKAWSKGHRRRLAEYSTAVLHVDQPFREAGAEEVFLRRDTLRRILSGANLETTAICSLILERGANQKEIGDALGMTSRAVEGQMRRLRLKALEMKRRGEIDVWYGSPAPRAGGRS
ncbi:hypothetical protein [Actinacidiphila glaucinigra]|uniref:hypothetical protein n=1 Tax=Actinacidiphila glaucinigra TaxID=235986 RepID=UPI00371235FE